MQTCSGMVGGNAHLEYTQPYPQGLMLWLEPTYKATAWDKATVNIICRYLLPSGGFCSGSIQ